MRLLSSIKPWSKEVHIRETSFHVCLGSKCTQYKACCSGWLSKAKSVHCFLPFFQHVTEGQFGILDGTCHWTAEPAWLPWLKNKEASAKGAFTSTPPRDLLTRTHKGVSDWSCSFSCILLHQQPGNTAPRQVRFSASANEWSMPSEDPPHQFPLCHRLWHDGALLVATGSAFSYFFTFSKNKPIRAKGWDYFLSAFKILLIHMCKRRI